jgi:hypothetical protein
MLRLRKDWMQRHDRPPPRPRQSGMALGQFVQIIPFLATRGHPGRSVCDRPRTAEFRAVIGLLCVPRAGRPARHSF